MKEETFGSASKAAITEATRPKEIVNPENLSEEGDEGVGLGSLLEGTEVFNFMAKISSTLSYWTGRQQRKQPAPKSDQVMRSANATSSSDQIMLSAGPLKSSMCSSELQGPSKDAAEVPMSCEKTPHEVEVQKECFGTSKDQDEAPCEPEMYSLITPADGPTTPDDVKMADDKCSPS